MRFAKFVISPHGAGITNFTFTEPKSTLLELVNKKWQKTCFAEMCDRLDVSYQRVDCEEIEDEQKNMELRDIVVDVENLEQKLNKFLK